MGTDEEISRLMTRSFPRCPLCGSNIGYRVTSVIKGNIQCKSCRAEWSSPDFVESDRLQRLRIKELPYGVHSYKVGKHLLRRYEDYPIGFWKSLVVAEESERETPLHWERKLVAEFLLVAVAALVVFLPGIKTFDIGWDEPVYVHAGRAYVEALISRDFFSSVWAWNHEHPPLAKYVYGYFSLFLSPSLGSSYFGARVGSSIMAALTVAVTYAFASRAFNRKVGALSSAILTLTPFYYGMARYVSLDLPATLFIAISTWMFYIGVETQSVRWVLLSALFFGLGGSAKVSGFTVLLILVPWLLLRFGPRLFSTIDGLWKRSPRFLLAVIIYPLVGATLFITVWPWLWVDTYNRLFGPDGVLTYADRFRIWGHEEFFGGSIVWHPPLYYYPYYFAVKTPLPTLLFFAIGVALLVSPRMHHKSGQALLLTAIWFAVPLAVQTYQQPYDALRPVLLVFPPMAILSALGAECAASLVAKVIRRRRETSPRNELKKPIISLSFVANFAIFGILLFPSLLAILSVRPLEISYFNELAGDSSRIIYACESSFWAEGLGVAVKYVNEVASPGASISVIGEMAAFNEFHRSDLRILGYVSPRDLASHGVEFVVFQGFYLQHFVWVNRTAWGSPNSALDLWEYVQSEGSLVYLVKAGNAPLVWIYKV